MNLRELNTFLTVVKQGSFYKAAEALSYTPTSVTNQVQNLERDLGVVLLERGKTVRLTPAGQLLYDEGLELIRQNQRVEDAIREFQDGIRGTVAIGLTNPFLDIYGSQLLAGIREEFPGIQLQLSSGYSEELSRRLKEGQLDFVISEKRAYLGHMFTVTELLPLEYNLVAVPKGHRLEGRESIQVRDLNGERIMMGPQSSPWSRSFANTIQEKGCTDFTPAVFDQVQNVLAFVESGYMISFQPDMMLHSRAGQRYQVSFVHVDNLDMKRTINLLTNEQYTPLTSAQTRVKEYILDFVEQLRQESDHL